MDRPPDSTSSRWGILLGALVAFIYFMQWYAMDRAMKVDQRAWVGPINVRHMHPSPSAGVRVQLALINVGKTPAFVSSIQKNSLFLDGDLTELPPDPSLQQDFAGRAVLFPNQAGIGVDIPAPDYTDAEYSDIFGGRHFTKFCYHYVVTWGPLPFEGLTGCRKYNDTDDSMPN